MGVDGLLGLFALMCGIYCLYGYYMLKVKGQIVTTILLPKGVDVKKCKDYKAYCKEAELPLLILGVTVVLYGASDLYNTYVGGAGVLFLVMLGLMLAALIYFAVQVRKINKKYFGV